MLVLLAAVAVARLPVTPAGREMQDTAVVGAMSFLGGAFLAPWLTMLCRNPIAGGLFALSIPAGLLVGSEVFSITVLGQVGTPGRRACPHGNLLERHAAPVGDRSFLQLAQLSETTSD